MRPTLPRRTAEVNPRCATASPNAGAQARRRDRDRPARSRRRHDWQLAKEKGSRGRARKTSRGCRDRYRHRRRQRRGPRRRPGGSGRPRGRPPRAAGQGRQARIVEEQPQGMHSILPQRRLAQTRDQTSRQELCVRERLANRARCRMVVASCLGDFTMSRSILAIGAVAALLGLAACADTDDIPQRGIDQDISATHDAGAATVRNLGPRGGESGRLGGSSPVGP